MHLILSAGALLLAAASSRAEEDYDFLPDPVARIGQRLVDREHAVRLLNSRSGMHVPQTPAETALKLRQLLEPEVEIAALESLLRRHQLVPGSDLVKSEARRRFGLLPENHRARLLAELQGQGLTFETYVEQLAGNREEQLKAAISKWLEQTSPALFQIADAEAEDYYRMRQGMFLIPEQAVFSRVEIGKTAAGRSQEQSRRLMESVAARLRQGEPFERLAEQFSECVVDARETLPRSALPEALAEVLFSLRAGETSGIVSLKDTFVIVRQEGIEPARYMPFAEVKEFIKEQLVNARIRQHLAREISRERDKLNVEFYF